jgi:hypothetical protein
MQDYYLKFTDEAQANSVLYTVTPEVLDEETNVVSEETVKPNYQNIDVLGTIYEPTAEVDSDGYPVMAALDGWHTNIRVVDGENSSVLQSYAVTPKVPRRVWS